MSSPRKRNAKSSVELQILLATHIARNADKSSASNPETTTMTTKYPKGSPLEIILQTMADCFANAAIALRRRRMSRILRAASASLDDTPGSGGRAGLFAGADLTALRSVFAGKGN